MASNQDIINQIYYNARKDKTEEQKQNIAYLFDRAIGGTGCFESPKYMTDEEYMNRVMLKKQSYGLYARALDRLGLDNDEQWEIPPQEFCNFIYNNEWVKRTKSGVWVSSAFEVTWMFFTDEQISIFQFIFNTDEDVIKESTEEYYYQDVTAISTRTETETSTQINGNYETVQTTKLALVVPGSTYTIAVNDTDNNFRKAVNAMRFKLKDKKTAN